MHFRNTFKNKKVFLTGHTGFKGSWMSIWLSMLGAQVKGYALKPEKTSLYTQINEQLKKHQSVIADIRNRKKLEKEILDFQPDFIFHLAAQPLVLASYKNPVETFEVNVTGTANLLDAVKNLKKKCAVVIVTTDKVYENLEKNYTYKETDRLGGYDPYSASKAAAEIITNSYRQSFFNPYNYKTHKKTIATARAGNVIGGGDYAENRIVPDVYKALSKSQPVMVRNPQAVRPWQHVLEPLHGYLTLAAAMHKQPQKFATSFNFGPVKKDALQVWKLVSIAMLSWGGGVARLAREKKAPHEAGLLMLDITKAKKHLKWKPRWDSATAIDKTMSWYKNSLNKNCNVMALCLGDIKEYSLNS